MLSNISHAKQIAFILEAICTSISSKQVIRQKLGVTYPGKTHFQTPFEGKSNANPLVTPKLGYVQPKLTLPKGETHGYIT